jgi:hypothetical protein
MIGSALLRRELAKLIGHLLQFKLSRLRVEIRFCEGLNEGSVIAYHVGYGDDRVRLASVIELV